MSISCKLISVVREQVNITLRCSQDHFRRIDANEADWTAGISGYEQTHPVYTKCAICGNDEKILAIGRSNVYDTADGEPHPGDMYYVDDYCRPEKGIICGSWDNCDGRHLHVVLPNGRHWDIDSRASNCSLPQDRIHRCWVRKGEAPRITVGKNGVTCKAGAGSILMGDYHGFLRDGTLT